MLTRKCILGLQANEQRCREQVANATAVVSALVAPLGYENAAMIANHARNCQCSIRDAACATGLITAEAFDAAVSAEAVCRLGSPIYTINHPKVNNNDAHNT
jgi:fumarate hydratase class II